MILFLVVCMILNVHFLLGKDLCITGDEIWFLVICLKFDIGKRKVSIDCAFEV